MSTPVDKVMQFVERELKKDPSVSNEKLFKGAKKISRTVGRLSPRQFHAKYPLQVKRRSTNGTKQRKTTRASKTRRVAPVQAPTTGNTDGVRKVMMKFAKDLAGADSQTQTIDVLANLDRYVADIMKVARN